MKYFVRYAILVTIPILFFFSCSKAQSKDHLSDLKEYKASEIVRMIEKGKPVTIVNAIIYDDLDLTTISEGVVTSPTQMTVFVNQPLYFQSCVFLGKVSAYSRLSAKGKKSLMAKKVHFGGDVSFIDCDFRKEMVFDESVIDGNLNFTKTIFTDQASFNHILVQGTQCMFMGIQANSNFQIIYSTIRGDISFMDAHFTGTFSSSSLVAKDLVLNNVQAEKRMDLSEMLLSGILMFNYGKCAEEVSLAFSNYMGRFSVIETVFDGGVSFERSHFFGMVKLNHSIFSKGLDTKDAIFYEKPEMNDVEIKGNEQPIMIEVKQSETIKLNH